jgi:hypothetical protein
MKNFNDVIRCVDVESLNRFICEYVDERKLVGDEKVKTYWALFYAWRDEIHLQAQIKESAKRVLGV